MIVIPIFFKIIKPTKNVQQIHLDNKGKFKILIITTGILIALRKETCKKILVYLLNFNRADFNQLQKAIDKSSGTTSITLKKLIEQQVIKVIHGFPKKYTLEDFEKTSHILEMMDVSYSDKLKDRFADTFSYF